jgi:hypothetical protein
MSKALEGETIKARNRSNVTPSHSHALQSGAWIEREQTSRGCASMNTDPAESERYMIFEGVIRRSRFSPIASLPRRQLNFGRATGRERIVCRV